MIIEMVEFSTQKVWLAKKYCINNSKSIEVKFRDVTKKSEFGFLIHIYFFCFASKNFEFFDKSKEMIKKKAVIEKIIKNVESVVDENQKNKIKYTIDHNELLKIISKKEINIAQEYKKYRNAFENRDMFYSSTLIMMLTKFEEAISLIFATLVKSIPIII